MLPYDCAEETAEREKKLISRAHFTRLINLLAYYEVLAFRSLARHVAIEINKTIEP